MLKRCLTGTERCVGENLLRVTEVLLSLRFCLDLNDVDTKTTGGCLMDTEGRASNINLNVPAFGALTEGVSARRLTLTDLRERALR